MTPKHQLRSQKVLAHLEGWGFSAGIQQRLGAFGVVWGVFEGNLETTLWALRGEKVAGVRPSTDRTSISQWIDWLADGSANLDEAAKTVLRSAAEAARNLMEYRHALIHGWMVPAAEMPLFIRNPTWNGEKRTRSSSIAHVDVNLLDLALDTAWVLCKVVITAREACSDTSRIGRLVALSSEVRRAAQQAGELRHLTELVTHEKY